MISNLESIFIGEHADIAEQIARQSRRYAFAKIEMLSRPLPTEDVSDWGAGTYEHPANIHFDEPKMRGPLNFKTRNYLREPLNLWRRDLSNDITDLIFCAATRTGKTRIGYAGLGYRIALDPCRCLWTMPMKAGAGGADKASKTKFIPMLRASPGLKQHVEFLDKNTLTNSQQIVNGSIVDWVGTGSPKQLAGNPNDIVVQDECDGYVLKGATEAHPSILADERTKDATNPLRFKCSTPTVEDGVIWQWLMRSDLRRYFLPCPRCNPSATGGKGIYEKEKNKTERSSVFLADQIGQNENIIQGQAISNHAGYFVLGWSEQYNVLPLKFPDGEIIPTAYVKWDATAKSRDGGWDLEKVMQTAHFECPHCKGKIWNHEKEWMDARGFWLPTKKGNPGIAGFQLSSLYVTHEETSIGALAKKFLLARENGQTMKGFVNNDLAEVDANQEHMRIGIEINSKPISQSDWVTLLTADFQKNHPFIWFVVRKWCAFKLHPPGSLTNGIPDFIAVLDKPGNEVEKKVCHELQSGDSATWMAIGELLRFEDPRNSALIEFLLAQKIIGGRLHKIFREDGHGLAMDFRRALYREFSLHLSDGKDPNKIRASRGGDSELIAAGYCEKSGEYAWDELKEYIAQFEIGKGMPLPGRCVGIDCGYAAKFDRQVLRKCHESGTYFKYHDPMNKNKPIQFFKNPPHRRCIPVQSDGWFAIKGTPSLRPMGSGKYNIEIGNHVEDPFDGAPADEPYLVEVLDFPQALFWNHKDSLRKNMTKNIYSVSPKIEFFPKIYTLDGQPTGDSNFKLEDYSRQLNQQFFNEKTGKVEPMAGRGGGQNRRNPYHLDDCETMNLALAAYNDFFDSNQSKT